MIESLLMFFIHDALFLLGYLAKGSAFPKPLSREEEAEMIARMQQGDERARETLIEHNLRRTLRENTRCRAMIRMI